MPDLRKMASYNPSLGESIAEKAIMEVFAREYNHGVSFFASFRCEMGDYIATTGQKLESMLENRKMSKHMLARRSGISYRTICRLVSGDKVGSFHTWIAISRALKCSLDELKDD